MIYVYTQNTHSRVARRGQPQGLCMLAIPEGETRKIDGIQTFILTSTFSVLAYLWVCVIVLWASPNIIEVLS